MLSRAVLPLSRPRVLSSTLRISSSLSVQHTRWYAKSKPKTSYKLPDSAKQSKSEKPAKAAAPDSAQQKPKEEEYSADQAEFDTTAQPQKKDAQAEPPKQPLPDLTQGIPSTLEAELEGASRPKKRALNLTEDPSQADDFQDDGRGGGDIPKDGYVSSLDRKRARMANITYALFLLAGIGGTVYYGRNWGTEEEAKAHPDAPSGWGFKLFYNRIKARLNDFTSYYKDPAFQKLLPDEDPQLRQPYTLVISLEDLLVHSEWSREHGWRLAKRPGVDYFLRYLNQYYELVLFTTVPSMMADQVLRKLDPYRIIRWPLFREATKYKDGEYVKVCFASFFPLSPELTLTHRFSLGSVLPEPRPVKGHPCRHERRTRPPATRERHYSR